MTQKPKSKRSSMMFGDYYEKYYDSIVNNDNKYSRQKLDGVLAAIIYNDVDIVLKYLSRRHANNYFMDNEDNSVSLRNLANSYQYTLDDEIEIAEDVYKSETVSESVVIADETFLVFWNKFLTDPQWAIDMKEKYIPSQRNNWLITVVDKISKKIFSKQHPVIKNKNKDKDKEKEKEKDKEKEKEKEKEKDKTQYYEFVDIDNHLNSVESKDSMKASADYRVEIDDLISKMIVLILENIKNPATALVYIYGKIIYPLECSGSSISAKWIRKNFENKTLDEIYIFVKSVFVDKLAICIDSNSFELLEQKLSSTDSKGNVYGEKLFDWTEKKISQNIDTQKRATKKLFSFLETYAPNMIKKDDIERDKNDE